MKRTRKLLCLTALLLGFVTNGWAQESPVQITVDNVIVDKTAKTKATYDCDYFTVEFSCKSSINTSNGFQFRDDATTQYFTITPKEGYTVTQITLSPEAWFKVGNDAEETQIGTYTKDITATTKFAAGTNKSTVSVQTFTISYKANGGSGSTLKNVTIGDIKNKSILAGESYDVTNPTAVEEGTTTAVAGSFSYTTANTDIVSISGNTITGLKGGSTATITATFTPDDKQYNSKQKTFTVTVTATGTSDPVVPAPMIKTLTYSTTKGIFDEEETLSKGDGVPYYGCIAVNAAYADRETGAFLDMSDKVSGLIYKFDTQKHTKDEFVQHKIAGITTVSTRSALITTEGHSQDLYLSVIAYFIKDGKRYYSDVAIRKYKYEAPGTRKELTLSCSESPFTLDLTEANKTSDTQGTLFNDTKTVTVTATSGNNPVSVSDFSFISRSSNRKLALSHMTKEGTTETTEAGNNILLMDKGRRAGVITVLVATPGNSQYLPAFLKVNVVLRDNTITKMETSTIDGKEALPVYTSIADIRTAGRQNPSQKCILQFSESNPATVVARFTANDQNLGGGKEGQNNIFITDNSGYGLMIPYKTRWRN